MVPAAAADADLKITVTNGKETAGDIRIQVRPAGRHDGDVIAWGGSGEDVKVPPGTYDVEVTDVDGAAQKTIWFDSLVLSGRVEKKVDMGMPVAALTVVITNGGADVGGNGTFEVRPAGQHGADVIAYEQSGGMVRVPAGTYDVDARIQDGSVSKMVWLDGLALSGTVQKTVEVGVPIADVNWHITNHGQDVGADGLYEIRPGGKHDGDVIAWGASGRRAWCLPATTTSMSLIRRALSKKTIWLDPSGR